MTDFRALIVDDDREMRMSLVDLLETAGWETKDLARATEVARWIPQFQPEVILSDIRMPGMTGLELLAELAQQEAPPIVLISAHGDIPMAVEAMQNGAYSFVEKPYEPRRLLSILAHAAGQHRMRKANARLRARLLELADLDRLLIGADPTIVRLRTDVNQLAEIDAACLILGETGSGKELVARALHDLGPRAQGPFVPVNTAQCALDQLFPLVRRAQGGTLFFDEIGACPSDQQAMLLRLVETKELPDPDTGVAQKFDLRVLSATNEDLTAAADAGAFRKDLFFRLSTTMLHLPPLRDRRDDIALLASHFLADLAKTYEITPPDLSSDDFAALIAHDWPGNVRELRNVCERRVLMSRRGTGTMAEAIHPLEGPQDIPSTLREAVAAFERQMIGKAISAHDGRMDAVAEALGIGRRTLNEKIVKLGLDKDALL